MAWNENLPEWNETGAEPPQQKKDSGWQIEERPPAGWFNWLFNRTYKVLQEIRTRIETAEGNIFSGNYGDLDGIPNEFTPSAHKSTHETGGSDALSPADIGAETPAGAQAKANAAESAANSYTDQEVGDVADDLNAHKSETATQDKAGHIKLSDIPLPTIATQAEAEEGTNNTKFMTPLRTHQAIDSKVRIIDNRVEIFIDGEWLTFIRLPDDESGSPGPTRLIAGDWQAGFFGEVSASELISGDALASLVGISQGTSQHSTAGWLKFAYKGEILFVAKKAFRNSISWDHINSANAVYGGKTVEIDGLTYKIRLMRGALTDPCEYEDPDRGAHGSEWNRLMLPIHQEAIDKSWAYPAYVESDIPVWAHNLGTGTQGRYTNEDLLTHYNHGSGSCSWCQETRKDNSAYRVFRGNNGVSRSNSLSSSLTNSSVGWRPVLELVQN